MQHISTCTCRLAAQHTGSMQAGRQVSLKTGLVSHSFKNKLTTSDWMRNLVMLYPACVAHKAPGLALKPGRADTLYSSSALHMAAGLALRCSVPTLRLCAHQHLHLPQVLEAR